MVAGEKVILSRKEKSFILEPTLVLKCYETISDGFPNRIFFPFPRALSAPGLSPPLFVPPANPRPANLTLSGFLIHMVCFVGFFPFLVFFPPRRNLIPLTFETALSFPRVQALGWRRNPTQSGRDRIKTPQREDTVSKDRFSLDRCA